MEFSDHERLFLTTICKYFHDNGEWPNYDYLDRVLSDEHDGLDVVAVGRKVEPFMCEGPLAPMWGWDPKRWVQLSITALYTCLTENVCPEVAEDLDAFMQVVRLFVEKYRARGATDPVVTDAELRDRFGMSDLILRKMSKLVPEAGLTNGLGYQEGTPDKPAQCTFTVSISSIRTYRSVTTIEDFVRVRRQEREERLAAYSNATAPSAMVQVDALANSLTADTETSNQNEDPGSVIALELVTDTRRYIEKVARQINTTYDTGCFDACAVMVRRLVETLIIEAFEANGIDNQIRDSADELMPLGKLIDQARSEKSLRLSRTARRALPHLKAVGDRAAHGPRYTAIRSDIDKFKDDLRVVVQELVVSAHLK